MIGQISRLGANLANHRAGGKTQLRKKLRALAPKTFQEWPSVKQEYGRYIGVLFGLKVAQEA